MIDVNVTTGSLDTDKAPQYVAKGDYQYALNIRNSNSEGSQLGVITNINGAELIEFNLPSGENTCIGECEDSERGYLYSCIHNSLGSHVIYRFIYSQDLIQTIGIDPEFKFSLDHYILGARVIGDQLFFNDALNEPRRVDIPQLDAYVAPPAIWDFEFTGGFFGFVSLQGLTPPPFTVGQQIFIRRNWRGAWVDAEPGSLVPLEPSAYYWNALYFNSDPNPQYSGVHTVTQITGNTVIIDEPLSDVLDFFTDPSQPNPFVGIGGIAYVHNVNRKYDAPFLERYIKLYRAAPHFPPYAKYGTDTDKGSNSLRGRLFQFKLRWVYRNGMKSHPSPISRLSFPQLEQILYPFADYPTTSDNYIDVFFDTGEVDVVGVELLVRESSNVNSLDFNILKYFDKEKLSINSNTSHSFRFYGDEVVITLPVEQWSQPDDYIPHRANDMVLIQDKRIAICACDEGFDHVDVDVEVTPQRSSADSREFNVVNAVELAENDNSTGTGLLNFPGNRVLLPQELVGPFNSTNSYIATGSTPEIAPNLPHPGNVISEAPFIVYNFSQSLLPINPGLTLDGIVVFLTARVRVSKTLTYNNGGGGLLYNFVNVVDGVPSPELASLAYAGPADNPFDYYWFTKTWQKVLTANDDPASVRDYFLNEIMVNDPINVDYEVSVTTGSGALSVSNVLSVNMRVVAFDNNLGVGASFLGENIYMSTIVQASVGSNPLVFAQLRDWYEQIGVNRLTTSTGVSFNLNRVGYKTAANHPLALEYRDDVGRRWPLSSAGIAYVPYFNENNEQGEYNVDLLVKIHSLAPEGATHYQFMYAGNSSMSNWLQFEVNNVTAIISEGVVRVSLNDRINLYNRYNNGYDGALEEGRSEISYSWTRGDRMRIRTFWGNFTDAASETDAPEFIDVEIISQVDTETSNVGVTLNIEADAILPYLTGITLDPLSPDTFGFFEGSVVEVYTPKYNADEEEQLYYEIGEVFKITNGQHHGNQLNQGADTPGSNSPFAQILLNKTGDAYVVKRYQLPEGYGETDDPPPAGEPKSKTRFLESHSYSDFYPSRTWGAGTPNRINEQAKREFKYDIVRYSDFFIAGTNVNNLNRFYEGNLTSEVDALNGEIQRAYAVENNLFVFQERGTGVMPVRAAELTTANAIGQLFRSDNVLGKINYFTGNFGISYHREALVYYNGTFFHPSRANGQYMALSAQGGYMPISSAKMVDDFQRMFDFINKSTSKVRIVSGYDVKYDELLVSIPDVFNVDPQPIFGNPGDPSGTYIVKVFDKRTLAYSPPKKGWVTRYGYWPDIYARFQNKLFTWKKGKLYLHNETDEWNQFHEDDSPQNSAIRMVFNDRATAVKFLQAMNMNSNTEPYSVKITSPYGSGQETWLFKDDFDYEENQYFAKVLRDENTPNVDNPILDGDVMRGQYFIVEIEFDTERKFELFTVTLRDMNSELTGR